MSYPVHLSEEALLEEAEAFLYYEDQLEGLGEQFLQEIEGALNNISQHPTHCSFSDATKTFRDLALVKFPFVIIYEIRSNRIEVYHIHHTKKNL